MSINWQNLRPWNGSQRLAFEQLCCQLAAYQGAPQGSIFIRKAAPDAGVECFWKLPNGHEWGWQAKFFLSPPDSSQWQQLDRSVKQALEKHPRLISYTVCLPIDRPDPRISGQEWFTNKWNEHVQKWEKWAEEKGMAVQFRYWGEHEIWERLSREEHRGRHLFWFSKELLSQRWFEDRVEEAVANAGPRYTPELHVELPISCLFDGLGRTPDFYTRVRVLFGRIRRTCAKTCSSRAKEVAIDTFDSLREVVDALLSIVGSIEESDVGHIDWDSVVELASRSREAAWECIRSLEVAEQARKETVSSEKQDASTRREEFQFGRHYLYELLTDLKNVQGLARSGEAQLSNVSALLLVGDAGTGKTHLLCDVAGQRIRSGLPTVLLLGEHFWDEEPWSQIIRLLGLSCTKEEFLGALEAAAQAQGAKGLIMIDALNEGEGRSLWRKHLGGILMTLSGYPWLGIALAVRTSYENVIVPASLVPDRLVREVHLGFADHEYLATRTFFDHFGIERPSVPLLVPEFRNPLFLKLFCQALHNRRLTKVPSGLEGITAVFDFFVESVDDKLSRPEFLDFDPRSQIVMSAVEKLTEMMADRGCTWLPRDEAQAAVNALLPRDRYEESLFRHLTSEGLLAEDMYWIEDDEWCEGIHFAYERFADHLIAQHLLDDHLDPNNPTLCFSTDQPLGSLVRDQGTCWTNRGLIEALSIQVPERIQKELAEVAPECGDYQPVRQAFVESLIWRDPSAITPATLRYINQYVVRYRDTHDQLLDALLTVASNPRHPYNAHFLHIRLKRLELAERDAWWSVFLHRQYGDHGAVDRLVDWAWSAEDKSHINDDSVMLCGLTLAWFLTTSNRFLRDRATKALVSLLTDRLPVLRQVIREFLDVNDLYVLERLLAVAYGCAMRSRDADAIGKLGQDVYDWIFKDGRPPVHILLRDYARGVIEVVLYLGVDIDIDVLKVTPPYESEWPCEIPTTEDLKKYDEWQEDMPDEEWARVHLYDSVMGFGDFARYIIRADSDFFEWSSRRLDEPRQPSRKEMYEDFVQSLTLRQKERWDRYHTICMDVDLYRRLDKRRRRDIFEREFSEEELESAIAGCEQSLRKTLGKKKLGMFQEYVLPYLSDPDPYKDECRFDLSIAQRWIFQRVLELGWTVERFGRFDRDIMLYSDPYRQETHKPERIGKKYQWIAYHEFLAGVADNFEFRGDVSSDRPERYEGPWQVSLLRDIDPSCLLRRTEGEGWELHGNTWWFTPSYATWESETDNATWTKNPEDLPSVEALIEVTNPNDGSRWLAMEGYYRWEQPTPPEEEPFGIARRRIWYMLRSYIVKKSDMGELFEWAKMQGFWGRWMPESHELYDVFLGEFFWAPAFEHHNVPYYQHTGWTRGSGNRIPKDVLVSTDQYAQGYGGYDCSVDTPIHIYLPAKWLADGMGLRWNGVDGHFFDDTGNLVAFDPSVKNPGPGTLLMNRDSLLEFLSDSGYDVLWTILGEKGVIGRSISPHDWTGRLELSGAHRIRQGQVEGVLNSRFVP